MTIFDPFILVPADARDTHLVLDPKTGMSRVRDPEGSLLLLNEKREIIGVVSFGLNEDGEETIQLCASQEGLRMDPAAVSAAFKLAFKRLMTEEA